MLTSLRRSEAVIEAFVEGNAKVVRSVLLDGRLVEDVDAVPSTMATRKALIASGMTHADV